MLDLLASTIFTHTNTHFKRKGTLLTTEGDSVEQDQLCAGWYRVNQMFDFIVGLICHPAVDHVCVVLVGFQQFGWLRLIELDGLITEGLA